MVSVKEASKTSMWQHYEDVSQLLQEGVLFKGCDTFAMEFPQVLAAMEGRPCAILENFARSLPEVRLSELVSLNAVALSPWGGDLKLLEEDLDSFLRRDYRVAVLAGTDKAAAALRDDLAALHIPVAAGERELTAGRVCVLSGSLSGGMELPELKFALITHGKAATKTVKRKKSKKPGEQIRSLSDLTFGDYVVHAAHGIGVFEGVVKREIHGVTKDYIKIRYAGTDALFVPVTQLDLVSKYIGPKEDSNGQAQQAQLGGMAENPAAGQKGSCGNGGRADQALRRSACRLRDMPFPRIATGRRSLRNASPTRRPTTSCAASPKSKRIWSSPAPWTGFCAGMWALAKRRWHSGRRSNA